MLSYIKVSELLYMKWTGLYIFMDWKCKNSVQTSSILSDNDASKCLSCKIWLQSYWKTLSSVSNKFTWITVKYWFTNILFRYIGHNSAIDIDLLYKPTFPICLWSNYFEILPARDSPIIHCSLYSVVHHNF